MALARLMLIALWKRFLERLKKEIDFFRKKPLKLLGVNKLAEVTLNKLIEKVKSSIMENAELILALSMNAVIKKALEQKKGIKLSSEYKASKDELLSDEMIDHYVSNSPELRAVLSYASNSFNDDAAGDISNACADPSLNQNRLDELISKLSLDSTDAGSIMKSMEENSDLESRAETVYSDNALVSLLNAIKGVLPYVMLALYLMIRAKEFINQNEHPSPFRGKYLSRLASTVVALLKTSLNDNIISPAKDLASSTKKSFYQTKNNIVSAPDEATAKVKKAAADAKASMKKTVESLVKSIKTVDATISAVLLVSALYLFNRALLQRRSKESANSTFSSPTSISCSPVSITEPFLENPNKPLVISKIQVPDSVAQFSCPIDNDEDPGPSIPVDATNASVSCESIDEVPSPEQNDPQLSQTLPQKAVFSYVSPKKKPKIQVSVSIKEGQNLKSGDQVFYDKESKIEYSSPIECRVQKVDKTNHEIYVEVLPEPDEAPIEELKFNELQKMCTEKSQVEEFMKTFYAQSFYPVMVNAAITRDSSSETILYSIGGVESRWNDFVSKSKSLTENFENWVSSNMSSSSIRTAASSNNDENLGSMVESMEEKKKTYNKNLRNTGQSYLQQAKRTKIRNSDKVLSDYYVQLWNTLLEAENSSSTLESRILTPPEERVEDPTMNEFMSIIADIVLKRLPVDKFNFSKAKTKIGNLCKELEGTPITGLRLDPFTAILDYYNKLNKAFEDEIKGSTFSASALYSTALYSIFPNVKSPGFNDGENPMIIGKTDKFTKAMNAVSNYLTDLGKSNKVMSEEKKNSLNYRIVSLFFLTRVSETISVQRNETIDQATLRESSTVNEFLSRKWKSLNNLEIEVPKKIKEMQVESFSLSPSGTTERDNESFIWYTASPKRDCPIPEEDGYLSPLSKYNYGDIKYWRRYCTYATLASVMSGTWAVGIIPPAGPTPFPTIYVPIKPWQKEWGVILMGLTITGVYVFPFLMVGNLSTSPQVAFGNPAKPLKDQIKSEKKALLNETANLKKSILKPMVDASYERLKSLKREREKVNVQLRDAKQNKPRRVRKATDDIGKALEVLNHAKKMEEWTKNVVALTERRLELGKDIFVENVKHKSLRNMQKELSKAKGSLLGSFKPIEKVEEAIEWTFRKLESLAEKIDKLIGKLPITAIEGSANFGPTAKNPSPMTSIDDGLIDTLVNQGKVDKLMKGFEVDKESMMSSKFGSTLQKTFINNQLVKRALAAASVALVPKDPFPKYENLKITNVSWSVAFLLPKWATSGSKQFGFPGFPPFPVNKKL